MRPKRLTLTKQLESPPRRQWGPPAPPIRLQHNLRSATARRLTRGAARWDSISAGRYQLSMMLNSANRPTHQSHQVSADRRVDSHRRDANRPMRNRNVFGSVSVTAGLLDAKCQLEIFHKNILTDEPTGTPVNLVEIIYANECTDLIRTSMLSRNDPWSSSLNF